MSRVPKGSTRSGSSPRLGAYAFLIETHTEFQPSYASALNEAAMVWPGILAVLERPISVAVTSPMPPPARRWRRAIDTLNVTFPNGETNSSGGRSALPHVLPPAPTTSDSRGRLRACAPHGDRRLRRPRTLDVRSRRRRRSSPTTSKRTPGGRETRTAPTPQRWASGSAATRRQRSSTASSSRAPRSAASTIWSRAGSRVRRPARYDLDGGRTSIQSPAIVLPADGTLTLSFSYYFAHGTNSSAPTTWRVRS